MKKAAAIFFLILLVISTYGSVRAGDAITGSELIVDTQAAGRPGFWMSQKIDALGGSRASIWKSSDIFGGSSNYFDRTMSQLSPANPEDKDKMPYVSLRIINCGIGKEGRAELIVARNFSQERRWFENLRIFTSGEVYDMEWDGLGFAEKWRTKKIQDYVADYQIKDIDNDGKPAVVMAIVTSGYLAWKAVSVVVAFSIDDK
ncbi:MAG: hypothetical protein ABSG75_06890 [Syntrophales bacterium]